MNTSAEIPKLKSVIHQFLHRSEGKRLIWLAAVGLGLSLISCLCMALQHAGIAFSPKLRFDKPASICAAFTIFLITTAILLPYSGLSSQGRIRFSKLLSWPVYYGFADEMIQTFRGVDPRFGRGNFLTNVLPGIIDGVLFGFVILLFVYLLLQFLKRKTYQEHPLEVLAIRYGLLASMLGFASGIWMVMLQGRYTGLHGNVMTVHFLGFHGLQAVPILAWILGKSAISLKERSRWVHLAGILWLLVVGCGFVLTGLGYSLFDYSLTAVLPFYILLIVWISLFLQITVLSFGKGKGKGLPASATK